MLEWTDCPGQGSFTTNNREGPGQSEIYKTSQTRCLSALTPLSSTCMVSFQPPFQMSRLQVMIYFCILFCRKAVLLLASIWSPLALLGYNSTLHFWGVMLQRALAFWNIFSEDTSCSFVLGNLLRIGAESHCVFLWSTSHPSLPMPIIKDVD